MALRGFEIHKNDGTILVGYVASQTDESLTLRIPGGASAVVKTSELAEKKPLGVSLMPANLQAAMTVRDLVDLVEYLQSLRK